MIIRSDEILVLRDLDNVNMSVSFEAGCFVFSICKDNTPRPDQIVVLSRFDLAELLNFIANALNNK